MIKVVKIHKGWTGCENGMHQVMRVDHSEYVLKALSGGAQFMLYIAHTYEDMETKRKGAELTRDRAAKIGNRRR